MGNISSVTQNGKLTSYAYDPLGQLIRVNDQNDTTSGAAGTTWTYAYDLGGNILNKKRYAYTVGTLPAAALETVTYAYTDANWKDKLTEFNGSYITYDEIGNPTSDGEWLYAWEKGRQLKAMSKASETVVFEYNADGLRVKKIATSTGTTHYTLHGKQITHLTNGSNTLHFFYDAAGKPAIVEWNNGITTQKFAYIHNLQGDIVGIIDNTGTKVVSYTYDAWGKPLSTTGSLAATLGKLSPFRYRGYVFDEETGLYYLRSRYYRSNGCRFFSADAIISKRIIASNLYQYCRNNAIIFSDSNGFEEEKAQFPYPLNATKMKEYVTTWWSREAKGLNPQFNSGREDSHCAGFMSEMLYAGGYPTDEEWFYKINDYLFFKSNNSSSQWVKSYGLYDKIVEDGWNGITIKDDESLSKAINDGLFCELALVFFFDNEHSNNPWHVGAIGSIDKQIGNAFYYAHTKDRDGSNPEKGHDGLRGYINPDTESYVVIFNIVE